MVNVGKVSIANIFNFNVSTYGLQYYDKAMLSQAVSFQN